MTASALFVVYSWMVQNWVFVVTNGVMLLAAIVGQAVAMRAAAMDSATPEP
jgi:MtN3 and saliva related transmembrane protein